MTVAQGAQEYHSVMRNRLKCLCSECQFKNEPRNRLCKKDKTDCMFYNLVIAETALSQYPASALKDIPINVFVRSMRVLGYSGVLEKTTTVKI